ncbi:HD-GYP domain (HD superfamily hydrolase) [hydrothermal vent metagenome]|uniref:HD-GYP domain (HD superfamily hydrolase) n=1 Tax=hydrothermal vent metagenome TaxID=652676 RepID=A0A3B1A5K5_9ZZZZ
MSDELEKQLLDKLFSDLENDNMVLPTLPEVALRVRETLEDHDAGMGDVAKIITTDAALSARLIQVANSPLLRAARAIESVEVAVTRMGGDMTRNLVTSIVMEQMFQATSDATDSRLRAIWEHSTQVAAMSHALTSQFTKLKPDQALLAGLVHDIGVLPILTMAEDIPELLDDEKLLDRIIQKAHPSIGEAILKKWNFAEDIISVAAEHENISRDHPGDADYVDVIIVANMESHLGSNHAHASIDLSTVPAFAKLGLEAEFEVVDIEAVKETQAALA